MERPLERRVCVFARLRLLLYLQLSDWHAVSLATYSFLGSIGYSPFEGRFFLLSGCSLLFSRCLVPVKVATTGARARVLIQDKASSVLIGFRGVSHRRWSHHDRLVHPIFWAL